MRTCGLLTLLLLAAGAAAGCGRASQHTVATPTEATQRAPAPPAARPRLVSPHEQPVPILMYHVVGTPPADAPFPGLYVSRHDFAGQLRWLSRHSYTAVTLRRVYDYWRRGLSLPQRPVVLTFDDGYREDFTNVQPLLRRRHWPGVLNLAVENVLDRKLTIPQVRALIRNGWEIDAHTLTHPDLTTLSASQLPREIGGSRAWIRRHFHVPASFFTYPSGRYDARVIAAVRAAAFLGALTENYGAAGPGDGFLSLDRIRIDRSDGVAGLAAKLSATG